MCEICCIPYEESPHVRISADGLDRQFNGVSNSEMRSLYYALMLTYPAYRKMHMDPITTVDRDGVSMSPYLVFSTISQQSLGHLPVSSPLPAPSSSYLQVHLGTVPDQLLSTIPKCT